MVEVRASDYLGAGVGQNGHVSRHIPAAVGHLRMAQGRWREALSVFTQGDRVDVERRAAEGKKLRWAPEVAVSLGALGKSETAAKLAADELARARALGAPRAVGIALRALALTRPSPERLDLLLESATILEGSQSRLEHARVLTDLGAALRRTNQRAMAREHLQRATEVAQAGGAMAIVNRAQTELEATGAKRRERAFSGVDALTASELRVASMASEGMTNNAIAQALFVTPKTVEMHLRNSFRKLDIRSRTQLPAQLA